MHGAGPACSIPATLKAAGGRAPGAGTLDARDERRLRAVLARRLRRLAELFPLDAVRSERIDADHVVRYYEHCHDAYRKYHSSEGAVHMALNDGGRFDPTGFRGQLRRIEQVWAASSRPSGAVLELAFGQGFNLADLAQRHGGVRFTGIDLTPAHLRIAEERLRREGLATVKLDLGDFHALPYADESFDHAWCIEAFCHAAEPARALAEVARVLRPGGSFVLFDGYLTRPPSAMQPEEALAVELVARGLAMAQLQVVDQLIAQASAAGLVLGQHVVLDEQVLPGLRRLERITGAVVRWPWLARRALARRHPARSRNVLAGCLMHATVALGLVGYRQLVLVKGG
jgi:SAM-dependent methyltransferase